MPTKTKPVAFDASAFLNPDAFKSLFANPFLGFADAGDLSKKNLEAVVAAATAAAKGAEALGAQAFAFSKAQVEHQTAAVQSLASARTMQDVIELQTAYAKTAAERATAEAAKATETLTSAVQDAFRPLTERLAASFEKLQPTG